MTEARSSSVITNTFADSAGQLVVSPIARAGFRVRCDIGWDDTAGKTRQGKLCVTSARCPRDQRCVVLFPVMFAVATKAVTKAFHQILAAGPACRACFELAPG